MVDQRLAVLLQHPEINPLIYLTLPPSEAEWQLQHIKDSGVARVIASHVVCLVIAYIGVILRFMSRRMKKTGYHSDDWMMVIAVVFTTGFCAVALLTIEYGGGRHAILLKNPTGFAKGVMAAQCLSVPAIGFAKFSTLVLYKRIFPLQKFHWVLWGIGFIILINSLTTIFTAIFQCTPIKGAWDPTVNPKCINLIATLISLNTVNAFTDIVLVMMPLPHLWGLQIARSTKLQLLALFSIGGFVSIVAIYRITVLPKLTRFDGPWTDMDVSIWTMVEFSLAIFCACAITFRPIFNYLLGTRNAAAPPASHTPPLGRPTGEITGGCATPNDKKVRIHVETVTIESNEESLQTSTDYGQDDNDVEAGKEAQSEIKMEK